MIIKFYNAYIIDPFTHKEGIAHIVIEDGIISEVKFTKPKKIKNQKSKPELIEIDASGLYVFPGLLDMHTHLREPGFEYKETIKIGTLAAVRGGFTSVCCMANTNPVNDNPEVTYYILAKAKEEGSCDVYPVGAITKGLKGEELSEMALLKEAGCVAFSDDGMPVMNSLIMRRALEYSKAVGAPIISHCEDLFLSEKGAMNEGKLSFYLGLKGIPRASEEVMVARDIILCKHFRSPLHIAHVSSKGSVELIKRAKEDGISVTAETCPHYFTLTEDVVSDYNTNAKVNPPLKTDEDKEAIKSALREEVIDVIATDHAPHSIDDKNTPFQEAANGISGLETALALSLRLVHDGVLPLNKLIEKFTVNPAKILKIYKAGIKEGAEADLILVDINKEWIVKKEDFVSLGKNTPFDGWNLKGKVLMTLKGKKVFDMRTEK
ncbi:MAG: dihydroorotase [Thermodesulfovibrio sp.]|uniref:dihydroorotase n=1 Tax=unclassified Thermodesulfovibrio TaxID=2645936 RepID=UPI00083AA055|nr:MULTISPECIES: dihydroorotase [unclassified Thermodesulfovibrio]MDI1472226.1 dihydroorotase [Thermodesulfovibrio sp. 1176]MDI6714088.1 dihydroorotase [Thermodesulfovibrio sp.]ODA44605.1 Dihydroorotase [Thermodesulfovibrio sp. N1]